MNTPDAIAHRLVQAGDIVTTGALSGMHPVGLATEVTVIFTGLGKAEAKIGARPVP